MTGPSRFSFDHAGLDRAAHLRADTTALRRQTDARMVPIWQGKPLMTGDPVSDLAWISCDHPIGAMGHGDPLFLGLSDGAPRFVLDISSWQPEVVDVAALTAFADPSEQVHPDLPEGTRFAELRGAMTRLSAVDGELAAVARALTQWHASHGFCAACGTASEIIESGWQRRCPSCGTRHFPRTDPVVIMLITRGNSVLMGRSPGWPEGMYSLLAGFVEPGESPEDAVRREVFEESGIRVGPVRYLASQAWPFPTNLMTAWAGEALNDDIQLDPVELEDALWISREDMAVITRGDHPQIKAARQGAIARAVIDAWLADRLEALSRDPGAS